MSEETDVSRVLSLLRYLVAVERLKTPAPRQTAAFARNADGRVLDLGIDPPDVFDLQTPLLTTMRGDARHADLVATALAHRERPEDLELVLAVGLVSEPEPEPAHRAAPADPGEPGAADPAGTDPEIAEPEDAATGRIARHAVVVPARLDVARGRVALLLDGAPRPELREFCDPERWSDELTAWEQQVRRAESTDELEELLALAPGLCGGADTGLRIEADPTLVLRARGQQPVVGVLNQIIDQIESSGEVPPGLLPLVDEDQMPPAPATGNPGAFVELDGEQVGPLPLNPNQLEVVRRVGESAQVVVQGPPGTGKTHVIAALLTDLLAQGQRVLVTAPTDRALTQVREKLPEQIRPLAVSVLGSATDEFNDLGEAVARLADESTHERPAERSERIAHLEAELTRLAAERRAEEERLVAARRAEAEERPESGRPGTLAEITTWHRDHRDQFGWVREFFTPQRSWSPVGAAELLALLHTDTSRAPQTAELEKRHAEAVRRAEPHHTLAVHKWLTAMRSLPPVQRRDFTNTLKSLRQRIQKLRKEPVSWAATAVDDVLTGADDRWITLTDRVQDLLRAAHRAAEALGRTSEVRVSGDVEDLPTLAAAVAEYLEGNEIRLGPDGMPRTGLLAPRVVRRAQPLFERVRVDQRVPVTAAQLDQVQAHFELQRLLDRLDDQWRSLEEPPPGSTDPRQRLAWYDERSQLMGRLQQLSGELGGIDSFFSRQHWEAPVWRDFTTGNELLECLAAIPALEHEQSTSLDLQRAERERDQGREQLLAEVQQWHPVLAETLTGVRDKKAQATWEKRLRDFDQAWAWGRTDHWLATLETVDVAAAQARIGVLDDALHTAVTELAAERAWQHALSPQRLTPKRRAALTAYVQQLRQLGRGTGKYAGRIRSEIRSTLASCRPAVPAWVMPLYRVAEQVEVRPDAFDVVIIDEASQAGLDAVFLQQLAPRTVVVGDDLQVSPAGVGRDQKQLRQLAREHGLDREHTRLWTNPMRSYFDEATLRFGSRLVLTEHRRSVPEIIEFSNQIAYQPAGIRLQPVRQSGGGGLVPFRTVFVPDASVDSRNVNAAEVAAVVRQVRAILADPRCAGRSVGVVTLLGTEQARAIAAELREQVPAGQWLSRRLQVGEPSSFQGSERDIMVVSMVAAPGGRLVAQTREVAVQRFNVAVSRARDQVVLVHSVRPEDLPSQADLRWQLLQHARQIEAGAPQGVQEVDRLHQLRQRLQTEVVIPPFRSLLQQKVLARLLDRGYFASPQQRVQGVEVDLSVGAGSGVGGSGSGGSGVGGSGVGLAIQCEATPWAGAEAYRRELRLQRDLERSGWRFVRIRASQWVADPDAAMEPVWEALGILGLEPVTDQGVSSGRAAALERYQTFTGPLAEDATLADQLVSLVGVEGPVVTSRILQAYAGARGDREVSQELESSITETLRRLVAKGSLVVDDARVGESEPTVERSWRLPDQPEARARTLGPRLLRQLPVAEAALLLDLVSLRIPEAEAEERYAAVLDQLGVAARLDAGDRDFLAAAEQLD